MKLNLWIEEFSKNILPKLTTLWKVTKVNIYTLRETLPPR